MRRLRQLPLALVIGGTVVAVLLITAVFGPLLAPDSATAGNIAQRLWNVGTAGHLLGTDGEGRDVLSRLIIGARPTMIAGIVPVLVGGILGTALGILAGMSRRGVRSLIMRTLDVFYAFPAILLAIAIGAALGPGVGNAIISLSIVLIAPIARVAESEVLQMRSADFMEAAYASGARRVRIARRHVLPNIAPPLIVYCTSLIGLCIVYAAGLSFLGLGVVPPHPDWGGMLNDLRSDVFTNSVLSLVPAIAIFIASIGFNLLGGGLRQLLNVRERDVAA
ncbi:MAG TPA: ABC transporter permease [Solirubrobacteraceae bacterium]|nr:ABC transporter permease [Solirubrobacteraceae bacterium]